MLCGIHNSLSRSQQSFVCDSASQLACRTNVKFRSAIRATANADPESADLRYERIPKDGRTFRPEYRVCSRPQVLSIRLRAALFVCVYMNRMKLKEDARDRESDGKKERERGKSGRPSKTGRTGFSGRVGESLYSVSLFLYARLCAACTLESAPDTSATL